MSDSEKAVFLSYASQDAEAAKKICDALRAAGVEVWFDQSELAGGDAWDAKIRGQIGSCGLFMPVISASTQARLEGYFRLEWKLAAQRTHTMADEKTFLLPILLDGTRDTEAKVPAEFKAVQWTRLPAGETPPAFAARVKKLLEGEIMGQGSAVRARRPDDPEPIANNPRLRRWWWLPAIFGVSMALLLVMKESRPGVPAKPANPPAAPALSPARQLAARALQFRSLNGLTRERLGAAEDLLEQALKLDPSESDVWAVGAQVDVLMVYRGWDISDARRQSAAKRVARALALAPDGFESRHAQAVLAGFMSEPPGAEAEVAYRALLREQPANRDLLEEWGTCLRRLGRTDEAGELFQRAGRPVLVGWADYSARRFDEARQIVDGLLAERRTSEALTLKASVELFGFNDRAAAQAAINGLTPTELREDDAAGVALRLAVLSRDAPGILKLLEPFPHPFVSISGVDYPRQYWTGIARMLQHQPEAAEIEWRGALQALDERLKAKPDDEFTLGWASLLHARLGDKAGTERALRLYGNYDDLTGGRWDWSYCLALLCLGDRNDEVIDRLDKTLREPKQTFNYVLYAWARFSPEFDPVRGNPRFEKLLRDTRPKGAKPFDDPKPAAGGSAFAKAAADWSGPASPPDQKSVAVLAFANRSDDKANEYFSDGISEELLNVLAKVPGLKVSARTSAFYFKGKEVPVPEIARQLGVAYVVEGSVQKQGDKVRIAAQLIKAADGFQVWSDTFTRDLKDIFAVQDEIAGLIAKNLSLKMGVVAARPTIDIEAYQEYLAGRALVAKASNEDLRAAVGHFEKALAIEPKFTAAWVQLASVHTQLGRWGGAPTLQAWAAARAAIDHAVALEPDSPDVLLALGWILRTAEWNWRGAEQAFRRALQLRPNHPETLAGAAVLLYNIGQDAEAFRLGGQAVHLDPLNPGTQIDLSLMFFFSEKPLEAENAARRALALAPEGQGFHSVLGWALMAQHRYDEAVAEANRDNDEVQRAAVIGLVAAARGQVAAARAQAARMEELARTDPDRADLQVTKAWIHAALGEKDLAFAALEKARTSRDPAVSWLRNGSQQAPLFPDPRWNTLLRQIGLTDEQLK